MAAAEILRHVLEADANAAATDQRVPLRLGACVICVTKRLHERVVVLSLIHISEPTRLDVI
eukprot:2700911-Prorocentrum_lima.AAC.1